MSSRSMSAVNSRTVNKVVMFNTRLTKFTNPPIHTGDLYVDKDLTVTGNTTLNNNLTVNDVITTQLVNASTANITGTVTSNQIITGSVNSSSIIHTDATLSANNYLEGQFINMVMLSKDDVGFTTNLTGSVGSTNNILSYNYTPKYNNSYIIVDFQAKYQITGSLSDTVTSSISVAGSTISSGYQLWTNASGGGTRSGTLFPLTGRYTNSNINAKTITVTINGSGADDTYTVYADNGVWLKITEICRSF